MADHNPYALPEKMVADERAAAETQLAASKHCPFCGGQDLLLGTWELETGEVWAVECNTCKAGAPMDAWNQRSTMPATGATSFTEEAMRQLSDGFKKFATPNPDYVEPLRLTDVHGVVAGNLGHYVRLIVRADGGGSSTTIGPAREDGSDE